ncbi:hypothetical protein Emag_002999 [Eimeria magna]
MRRDPLHQQEVGRQERDYEEEEQRQHRQQWQQQQQGATHVQAHRTLISNNTSGRPCLSQWPHQPQQHRDANSRDASSSNNCSSLQPLMQQHQQQQQPCQSKAQLLRPPANKNQYQQAPSMFSFQPFLGPQALQQEQQGGAVHAIAPANDAAAAASAAQMKALQDLACDLDQADEALESSRCGLSAWHQPQFSLTTDFKAAATPLLSAAPGQPDASCTGNRAAAIRQPKAVPYKRPATAAAERPREAHKACAQSLVNGTMNQQPRKAAKSSGIPQASAAAAESAAAAIDPAAAAESSAAAIDPAAAGAAGTAAQQPLTRDISVLDARQMRALYLLQSAAVEGAPLHLSRAPQDAEMLVIEKAIEEPSVAEV